MMFIKFKKMKNIYLIITVLTLSSCMNPIDSAGNLSVFAPKPIFLRNLPQGNDSYSVGFRQGCYNMIGQTGQGMMRMYDSPYDAVDYLNDDLYNQGYKHGDRHCGTYVNRGIIL